MDKGVGAYIKKQREPMRGLCAELRRLILEEYPGIREEIWTGVPWYGRRFYIAAFEDHVNMGFSVRGLPAKELKLFEGNGRYMRHVKILPEKKLDEGRILKLLRIARKSKCSI